MNKILGSVTQHPFEELVKRIDVNKNKATPEEFLSASKALRHIDPKNDPKKNYFQVDPRGDLLAEYILTKKVIPELAKEDWKKDEIISAQLSEAYYELSQVYSHLADFGRFTHNAGKYDFMLFDARSKEDLKQGIKIDMKKILENRIKLLRYAVVLSPDAPVTLNAWSRIIEIEEHDKNNSQHIAKTSVTYKDLYDLSQSSHWSNFLITIGPQYTEKKEQIQKILQARNKKDLTTLDPLSLQAESCLQAVVKKWKNIK